MTNLSGQQCIDGEWHHGLGHAWSSHNPYLGQAVWEGRWANDEQALHALQAAHRAHPAWFHSQLQDRISVTKRFAEQLEMQRVQLKELITRETGKPLWESDTEISAAIQKVQNAIDAILQRRWTTTEGSGDQLSVIRYHALGVMAVLGPFNLPLHLPGAHIVPALLAGNAIVFKPSEKTPGVGEFLVRCWQQAGVPSGVVNLVQGGADLAQTIVKAPETQGILFTGSYRAGRAIHAALAGQPEKMLALEMGGNNALVVDRTQSIDAAVYQILLSSFITSGQRCTCARRLILTREGNGQEVLDRLVQATKKIRVGDPESQRPVFMGSLISKAAADSIRDGQEHWLAQSARPILAMQSMQDHPAVLTPGILEATREALPDGELFGPLLIVQYADDLEDATFLANQSHYGLSAGLISDDVDAFQYFVHHVRAGIVNWNRQTTGASGKLPFGGIGLSGNHRPSGYFAADYCSYPIASLESHHLDMPTVTTPGLEDVFPAVGTRYGA